MTATPGVTEAISILRLILALAVFWIPGFWWTTWLHREAGYHWTLRAALGWAWSFAVFAPVAWPFLWFRGSFHGFLLVIAGVWLGFFSAAATLRYRFPPGRSGDPAAPPPRPQIPVAAALQKRIWPAVCLLLAYLTASGLVIWAPHEGRAQSWGWDVFEWTLYGTLVVGLIAGGCVLAYFCRQRLRPLLQFQEGDFAAPTHLVRFVALGFIVLQAASAALLDRPDWDDCYYLAAVLDYEHAESLNAEEPTHREGYAVNGINVLLGWELWQATLCWCSGLNPMAVAHTLLPGLLVLLAYAGYWNLLAESVPRRWVALAMLGVSAYHLWGASSHDTPANYLLTRIWQGKAVLIHMAVPLLILALREVSRQPAAAGRWLTLIATAFFGLMASSTAIFLEVMLLACLSIAFAVTLRSKGRWRILLAAALASLPAITLGLLIRQAVVADPSLSILRDTPWRWQTWFEHVGAYVGHGSAEALWLLLLPLLALVLHERDRMAYLVIFPLVLAATFANPLLADPVATHLTSYHTFFRVFWLFPVASGLGATLALLSRLFTRALARWGIAAKGQRVPLLLVIAGLALSWLLPTIYIWSERNVGMLTPGRGRHPLGPNLLKMPPDLVAVADQLLADPEISKVRILAKEDVTNYLTPYSRDFRLVQTRALYTLYMTDLAGRRGEGERRYLLTMLLWGDIPQADHEEPISLRHPYYLGPSFPDPPLLLDETLVRQWLDELRVKYLILETAAAERVTERVRQAGFRPNWVGEQKTLWRRNVATAKRAPE